MRFLSSAAAQNLQHFFTKRVHSDLLWGKSFYIAHFVGDLFEREAFHIENLQNFGPTETEKILRVGVDRLNSPFMNPEWSTQ